MTDRLRGAVIDLERRATVSLADAEALWQRLEDEFGALDDITVDWRPTLEPEVRPPTPRVLPPLVARRERPRWRLRTVGFVVATVAAVVVAAVAIPRLVDRGDDRPVNVLNEPAPATTAPTPTTDDRVATAPSTTEPPGPATGTWHDLDVGPLLSADSLLPAVWTGKEMLLFGATARGGSGDITPDAPGAAYDPATQSWRVLPANPLPRTTFDTVVWTGTEAILWGGPTTDTGSPIPTYNADGAAYNPSTDSWRVISTAPVAASRPEAVWTGTEMIVFGGLAPVAGPPSANPGLAYNPTTDHWRRLPLAPMFDACGCYRTVWTGSDMLVIGDNAGRAMAALAYHPATDSWRVLPDSPLTLRTAASLVWTDKELVEWGGIRYEGDTLQSLTDGAAFDPITNKWRMLPDAPIAGRVGAASVWTGREVLVIGGLKDGGLAPSAGGWLTDGAAYSPAFDRWVQIPDASLPTVDAVRGAYVYKDAWTGTDLVLWGGIGMFDPGKRAAAAYTPPPTGHRP